MIFPTLMATSVALTPDYSMLSILQLGFGSFSPFFLWPGLINLPSCCVSVETGKPMRTNEGMGQCGNAKTPESKSRRGVPLEPNNIK